MDKSYENIEFKLSVSVGRTPGMHTFFIHGFSETIGSADKEIIWKYGKTYEQNTALFDVTPVPVYALVQIAPSNDIVMEVTYIDGTGKEVIKTVTLPAGQSNVKIADDVKFVNFAFITGPDKVTQDIDFSIDQADNVYSKLKNVLLQEYQSTRSAFQYVRTGHTLSLDSFSASVGRADRAVIDGWIKRPGSAPFSPMGLRVYQSHVKESLPFYKVPADTIVFLTGISDTGGTDIQTQIDGFEIDNFLIDLS